MSGFSDFLGRIGSGFSSISKPLLGAASSFAPMAGTLLGGAFGGPAGAALGGSLGGMAGDMLGRLGGNNFGGQRPSIGFNNFNQGSILNSYPGVSGVNSGTNPGIPGMPSQMTTQMPSQMTTQMPFDQTGSSMTSSIVGPTTQALPPNQSSFSNLLQNLGTQLGGRLNSYAPEGIRQLNLGQKAGGFLGNQLASRLPSNLSSMQVPSGINDFLMRQASGGQRYASGGHALYGGFNDMTDLLGHNYHPGMAY